MKHAVVLALLTATAATSGCVDRPAVAPSGGDAAVAARLLPVRLRRLTNHELEASMSALVGARLRVAERLPPDVRQDGFSPNADQGTPVAWMTRLHALAREAAEDAVRERLTELAPCAGNATAGSDCASETVTRLGQSAYRRPLEPNEHAALMSAFSAGGGDFGAGVGLVLRALMTSPDMLYLSELGPSPAGPGSRVRLTPAETASLLSYTVRGTPPDEPLLATARTGRILDPGVREREARRLLGQSGTRHHFRRFVLEWLEVDDLLHTAKNAEMYPEYEALKGRMLAETSAFVDEVMVSGGASVNALLTAGFASVDPPLARYYGLGTFGPRASLAKTERVGILQQASFLSAHAHEDSTSPVKRGDFVMRRLLCSEVRRPSELGIEVVIPPRTETKTTRERFRAHVADAGCATCHRSLDALGFSFEGFDAAGRARRQENGRAIDSTGAATIAGKSLSFRNSAELSRLLAGDPDVARCFARHAFRYFSAQSDPGVERSFLSLYDELDESVASSLVEQLVAFVRSDLFVLREVRGS